MLSRDGEERDTVADGERFLVGQAPVHRDLVRAGGRPARTDVDRVELVVGDPQPPGRTVPERVAVRGKERHRPGQLARARIDTVDGEELLRDIARDLQLLREVGRRGAVVDDHRDVDVSVLAVDVTFERIDHPVADETRRGEERDTGDDRQERRNVTTRVVADATQREMEH